MSHFSGLAQLGLLTVVGVVVAGLVTRARVAASDTAGMASAIGDGATGEAPGAYSAGIGPRAAVVLIITQPSWRWPRTDRGGTTTWPI